MSDLDKKWQDQRQKWLSLKPSIKPTTTTNNLNSLDQLNSFWHDIPSFAYSQIYKRICEFNEVPNRRIPIDFMVRVLWAKWETEEWFPKEGENVEKEDEKNDDIKKIEENEEHENEEMELG